MFEDYCSFPNLGYVSFWCRVLAVETRKVEIPRRQHPYLNPSSAIHRNRRFLSLSQVAWSVAFSACPISPAHLWSEAEESWLLTEEHICFLSYQLRPHFAPTILWANEFPNEFHMIDSQFGMQPRHNHVINTTQPPLMKGPICICWLPSSA